MEEFYPSEIARLVLGYLKDAKCPKAWETFLEECSDLDEHSRLYKEGKFCSTNVNGKSLTDVLKEYCVLKREAVIENNQNKCAKNTYEFEVLKTPNKPNENAVTTIRINQKFQSQSVVSSSLGQIYSPSSRRNIFRTPPSRHTGPTPRRRLDCQATPLNFGPEADSPFRTYSDVCINKNANTSLRTPLRKRNYVSSTSNTCTSDSVLSVKSRFQEIVQNCVNPNFKNYLNADTTKNRNEHLQPASACQQKSSVGSNVGHTNAPESQNRNTNSSNDVAYSTQKEKIHNTFDYSDLVQFDESVSACEKQNSQTGERQEEGHSTLFSKVYQSSEITKGQNVSLSALENCFTPQYPTDPPPYNRAPFTNSPRIILSHDRSQVPSLTTPMKDTRCWMEEEWSPKRKGSIPRRRLITESPLSKYLQQPENLSFESMLEYMYGNEEELTNNPVVQLLTDNINKVKQNEMLKEQDNKKANEQDVNLENIVKGATELIEEDPILGKYFAVGLREEVNMNAELSAAKHCGVNSVDCDIESFPADPVENAPDKPSNDHQNENASQSVRNSEESDLLVNALRETFGEMTNQPNFSSNNLCVAKVNESNRNSHESFVDNHEADVNTNNLSVNIQSSDNGLERNNDVPDNSCTSTKQSCGSLTSNPIEKNSNIDNTKDRSNLSDGSKTLVDSVKITNTSEELNPAKNNLEGSDNGSISKADLKNGSSLTANCEPNPTSLPNTSGINTLVTSSAGNLNGSSLTANCELNPTSLPNTSGINTQVTSSAGNLNGSSLTANCELNQTSLPNTSGINTQVTSSAGNLNGSSLTANCELNQTSLPNTSGINTQVTSSVGNLESSNIPCTSSFVTPQLPSQPMVEFPVSLPYFGLVQNGVYRIIINSPITWNPSPLGGLCTSTVPTADISSPLIFNPAPVTTVSNVENGEVVNNSVTPVNIGNFVTTTIPGNQISPFINPLTQKSVSTSASPQIKSPPKRNQKNTKRKKAEKGESPLAKKPNKEGSASSARKNRKPQKKRVPKRKPLCLFPPSPHVQETPDKSNENVPVLSIPDTPSVSGQSSAFKLLSQITGQFEKEERSPVLKMLMTNAAMLSKNSSRLNSHVRCLDFGSNSEGTIEDNGLPTNNKKGKPKENTSEKSFVQNRRSLRIQQSKEKQNLSQEQSKNVFKSRSPRPQRVTNKRKRSLPKKRLLSTNEKLTMDMTAVILNSMEEARKNAINAKLTSETGHTKAASCVLPDEGIQLIDLVDDMLKNNVTDKLNACFNNDKSVCDPIVNDSYFHTELVPRQDNEISATGGQIGNDEKCETTVSTVKNVIQENTTMPIITKGNDLDNSKIHKPSEKLTISQPSFTESGHSQAETKNSDCFESEEVNTPSNEKQGSEITRTNDLNEKVRKHMELSNYLFGSDSSSDESNIEDNLNVVHQEPTAKILPSNTNVTNKEISISSSLEAEKSSLEEHKNTHLAVPDYSSKGTSYTENSTVISFSEGKYPRINKKSSSNSKPCDQLDKTRRLDFSDKKRTKESSEYNDRRFQNSPSIKRRVICDNSLKAEQTGSTVSIDIADNSVMYSDGEISDSDITDKSFSTCSNKGRENCRMEINTSDIGSQDYIESVILHNPSGDSCVNPHNAYENNKNISNERGSDEIQLLLPDTGSNVKEKNISKQSVSPTSKQDSLCQEREETSSKNSKNLIVKEGNDALNETRTSLEKSHGLLVRSDKLEERHKFETHKKQKKSTSCRERNRSQFSPDFIVWGKQGTNDPIRTAKQKAKCQSPSPCNVNRKDVQIIDSNISLTASINHETSEALDHSNVTNHANRLATGLVSTIKDNSSSMSKYPDRVRSFSDKGTSHQKTSKKSLKNQQKELKNFPQEINQSKGDRNPKASDLLTKSVNLVEKVSCNLKESLEVLSLKEKKNSPSEKHSHSKSLFSNSTVVFNADKQTGSVVVENHKVIPTSSSIEHNRNVHLNSKDSIYKHSSKINKDDPGINMSDMTKETTCKSKSPKNVVHPEMLKNHDPLRSEMELNSLGTVDANKGNSGIMTHSSNYSDSSVKTSSQIIRDSSAFTEKPKNQPKIIDKINKNSTAEKYVAGFEQEKNLIQTDSRISSQYNKREGSQNSKYQDITYNNNREARERFKPSSMNKNNASSRLQTIVPTKTVRNSSDRVTSCRSNVSKYNKNYQHSKSRRYSDNFEILKSSHRSRFENDYSRSVKSPKRNSKHCFTSCTTEYLSIRRDSRKNVSNTQDSVEHVRVSSSAEAKNKRDSFELPSTAYKKSVNSDSSIYKHSLTEKKKNCHRYSHPKKHSSFQEDQKHDFNSEKSINLTAKESIDVRDSSFQSNNEELLKDNRKVSDQETVLILKENVSVPNNKLIVSQDSFKCVDDGTQISSNVNVKSNNQSSTESVSAAQNTSVIPSVIACTVSESISLPQSDDSLTSTSSKDVYHGTTKINPPFKKRIRPIPVTTKSKLDTSAFTFCQDTVATSNVINLNVENPAKISSEKKSVVNSSKNIQEKIPKEVDAVKTVSNPVDEMTNSSAVITDSNSLSPEKAHLSNLVPALSPLATPTKEVGPTFVTPVKEVLNTHVFISPSSKSQASYPTTPSPKIKSTFRSPYPQSGKPKSMEYFYRTAFPDKKSDLPISPLSFSNSSCTIDAFSAKRQLLEEDSSSHLSSRFYMKNTDKVKAVINESNENPTGNVCEEEFNNQNFDGNETEKNCIIQEPSNSLNGKFVKDKKEQVSGNVTSIFEDDKGKEREGLSSDILGRKRKISESLYSDTCSTVVDCSDLEIMTPEKNDWLNKPLFSRDQSPMLTKKRKVRVLSSSSDATPSSSPEKEKNLISVPVCSSSELFPEISLDKSPIYVTCNSSAVQDMHIENLTENCTSQKAIIDTEKHQQCVKSISNTKITSHKSLHKEAESCTFDEEKKSLSELVTQDPKLNLLLSKIQIFGLDNILDRLKDK